MNIKELISWREKCFFCQNELSILPRLGGSKEIEYSLTDKYLSISSRFFFFFFFEMNINIITHSITKDIPSTLNRI